MTSPSLIRDILGELEERRRDKIVGVGRSCTIRRRDEICCIGTIVFEICANLWIGYRDEDGR